MTHEAPIIQNHGRWIVEFSDFRVRDDRQRRAIESLDRPLLDRVLEIWVTVVTPEARIVERPGTPVRTVQCVRRSDARKFVATWGGRVVTPRSQ